MKKTLLGLCTLLLLAGCAKTGTYTGQEGNTTAKLKMENGKITDVQLDVVQDGQSKKALGDDYGMKAYSSIGKEWYEQVEFLENYIEKNDVNDIQLDADGKATNEDVLSGCTIGIKDFVIAVQKAK